MYMYYLLGYRLMELPISDARKDVIKENTYLLALDGDIDFQPEAITRLGDLMKKNRDVGAACGDRSSHSPIAVFHCLGGTPELGR